MKIALFGASGTIGQRIAQEALNRGHEVTAIVRNPSRISISHPHLAITEGNVSDPASVTKVVGGHDAVINAIGPTDGEQAHIVVDAARALIAGLPLAHVDRLVVVGGAGSLEVAPGVLLFDIPDFPKAWQPTARAHAEALDIYRTAGLNWSYFSPAALIQPGQRTGKYRLGTDQLITNDQGDSSISAEDYAIALINEVEQPQYIHRRFTIGY